MIQSRENTENPHWAILGPFCPILGQEDGRTDGRTDGADFIGSNIFWWKAGRWYILGSGTMQGFGKGHTLAARPKVPLYNLG